MRLPPKEKPMPLTAIALNCSLKKSDGELSSTDKMIGLIVPNSRSRAWASTGQSGLPIMR